MRQVMIVDDERWVRRGLIQSIPWEELGIELAGEAEDGGDAYEMAVERKPDLLFLDMRMPGLDGKQLLGLLRRDLPELLTIVVSGYSDFEYTKEAIRNNAFDYLLKPVKKEELVSILRKALAHLDERDAERRRKLQDNGESWLGHILFRQSRAAGSEADASGKPPERWLLQEAIVFVALPDRYGESYETQRLARLLDDKLRQEKSFYMNGSWEHELTAKPGETGEIVVCIAGEKLKEKELDTLAAIVRNLLKQQANVSYSIGLSAILKEASAIPGGYRQARQSLSARKLGVEGAILYPVQATAGAPLNKYPQDKEEVLLLALQMGNEEAAIAEFDRFYGAISENGMSIEYLQQSASLLIHALERQLQASQSSLEELVGSGPLSYVEMVQLRNDSASIRYLFDSRILPAIRAFYGNRAGANQGEKIVREIQKLIEVHYAQPLSLHQIAESRFLNADYLSRLFKKTTGHNFVDYLTDYRIAKSIEYMKHSNDKNYEIARRVGYEDYRYFSQIFKKKTGKTIGEFRDSQQPTNNN
ncbi:response regulator [Cohnella boryungensis]|uniref:Response regulator n=1 Tax=Cohnella boryungensis TaxID=768479 RepID=A0ABV8S5T9_9BACL